MFKLFVLNLMCCCIFVHGVSTSATNEKNLPSSTNFFNKTTNEIVEFAPASDSGFPTLCLLHNLDHLYSINLLKGHEVHRYKGMAKIQGRCGVRMLANPHRAGRWSLWTTLNDSWVDYPFTVHVQPKKVYWAEGEPGILEIEADKQDFEVNMVDAKKNMIVLKPTENEKKIAHVVDVVDAGHTGIWNATIIYDKSEVEHQVHVQTYGKPDQVEAIDGKMTTIKCSFPADVKQCSLIKPNNEFLNRPSGIVTMGKTTTFWFPLIASKEENGTWMCKFMLGKNEFYETKFQFIARADESPSTFDLRTNVIPQIPSTRTSQ